MGYNKFLLSGACGALTLLSACSLLQQETQNNASKPAFVIVNVLDKEYYDDCHIKGSINVPFEKLESYALDHWDKHNTEIVLHCTNYKCTASGAAWQMLTKLGFAKVFAYEGGTAEAKQLGLAVEGPCKEVYLQDYAKPASTMEHATSDEPSVAIISVDELKKKIEEFAVNS
jgi:rhodanese-related sulfurtransferase